MAENDRNRQGMSRDEAGSLGGSQNTPAQQRARRENIKQAQKARRRQG